LVNNLAEKTGILRPNKFPGAELFKKSFGKYTCWRALGWGKIHRRQAFAFNPFVSLSEVKHSAFGVLDHFSVLR
jgi:hypothetical protein